MIGSVSKDIHTQMAAQTKDSVSFKNKNIGCQLGNYLTFQHEITFYDCYFIVSIY